MNDPIVRAMDTATEEQEISVSIQGSVYGPETLVVLADTTQIPYRRIYLTQAEARKLARFLDEQAAEAEAADLDAEGRWDLAAAARGARVDDV